MNLGAQTTDTKIIEKNTRVIKDVIVPNAE
jgi:hypothetical protein